MRKNGILTLIFFAIVGFTLAQSTEYPYDFNDLELADINGQDAWSVVVNSGGSDEMIVGYSHQGVVAHDGSQACFYGQSGGNYGRTASRISTDVFPFDFASGGIIEVEADIHCGWWGTLFGFGYDANNNGYLMPAIETVINIEDNEGGFGIHLANQSADSRLFYMPDGSTVNFTFPFEETGGWYRYKFFVDLDANDGAGSVTLFIKEMDGDWAAVTEIQDLNLQATPGSGDSKDPAMWTKFFLHGTGGTSGFDNLMLRQPDNGGLLFQYITFDELPDKLTTDPAFNLSATTSQSLQVSYSVTSGPATISGNTVTLTGDPGFVTIKASQPGNDEVAPAEDVSRTFEVVDANLVLPIVDIKNAVDDEMIRVPELTPIPLSVSTEIEYPHLLSVAQVEFNVDGTTVDGSLIRNGYFIGYWMPSEYGTHTLTVTATSSEGVSVTSAPVTFEVVQEAPAITKTVIDHHDFSVESTLDTTIVLPSFVGGYTNVTAYLTYDCPCDPWDRIASVEIRGANGEWVELLRYITPYGVACEDNVDITDFVSQLQGKIDFRFDFTESVVTLDFEYQTGTPEYKYSWMDVVWAGAYPFGDYENLQPCEVHTLNFAPQIEEAYLRLVCSGHGWGDNNSNNAAEFFETNHSIKVNGETEFVQELWQGCNPNPSNCMPQNGTWYHNRAGWCPGTIPMTFRWDLTPFINSPDMELMYEFDPDYMDYCHPHHPDCQTGVTCSDCNDMYNPNIIVAGEIVTFSNEVIGSVKEQVSQINLNLFPNPTSNRVEVSLLGVADVESAVITISTIEGKILQQHRWDVSNNVLDLSAYPQGIYILKFQCEGEQVVKKIIKH